MIIIALHDSHGRVKKMAGEIFRWCYIGKDAGKRQKVSDILGEDKRLCLKNSLNNIVKGSRHSFLDYISRIGKNQNDTLNWWASRFASRSPLQTDFFLLLCYRKLIKDLITEDSSDNNLVIFIEDVWLYAQIKDENIGMNNIIFIGSPQLWKTIITLSMKGIVSRFIYFSKLVLRRILVRYYYKYDIPEIALQNVSKIAILGWIDERAFEKGAGNFKDSYTGDLAGFLESHNIKVYFPTYLHFPLKFAPDIAKNKRLLWPLIFDAPLLKAAFLMLKYWKIKVEYKDKTLDGIDLNYLLKRELWKEFSSASYNGMLIYFYSMRKFFARKWCHIFHYPFENQPFEKMICLAAKDYPHLKLLGYRDSTTSLNQINMFLGKGEKEYVPLPHRIITMGKFYFELFKQEGEYPEGMLKNGGAWRFKHLLKDSPEIHGESEVNTVLVATPIDPFITKALLLDIRKSFKKETAIRFIIKCHPATPFSVLNIEMGNDDIFKISNEPVEKLASRIETIIYSNTTVGLELLVKGKKVIRYIVENLIDIDPIDAVPEELYFTCYEGSCYETILKAVQYEMPEEKTERMKGLKEELFGMINVTAWLEEITINPASQ